MAELKLQALDAEDLAVVSALCQDAVVRVPDLVFRAKDKRFALVCNRFDWESAAPSDGVGTKKPFARRRAGLRFERVTRAELSGFDPKADGAVLALLAMTFAPTQEPSGTITLHFAAGAMVRLSVDYIEVELKDLGAEWSTAHKPDHAEPKPGTQPVTPGKRST
jgi:hypothetical protein